MSILRKINVQGVDYDIAPIASKEQAGMIKIGKGLICAAGGGAIEINYDNKSIILDENNLPKINEAWISEKIEEWGISRKL